MQDNAIAVTGITDTYRTLADGRIKISLLIDPECHVDVAKFFGAGESIALVHINAENDRNHQLQIKANGPYGEQAKQLKQAGFFRMPAIWKAVGSDEEFLAWIRLQPCAYCKNEPNEYKPTEAAHVRRIADGAGVAIKPIYSAIPLCHDHHALQHAKGESALGGKEWFDKQRIQYVEKWAWMALKKQLGFESWSEIKPVILSDWANKFGLTNFLPSQYKIERSS